MTLVTLATLLLMPLASYGSIAIAKAGLKGIATTAIAAIDTEDQCKDARPLPSLKLHAGNPCYIYGGHFLFDEEHVGTVDTPKACQDKCIKDCHNWRFEETSKKCYVQVGSCANSAKYAANVDWSNRGQMKSGAWIRDANEGTVAGPRKCVENQGCYRHGVWYQGNDVGTIEKKRSVQECQARCKSNQNCMFFIYVTKGFASEVGIHVETVNRQNMEPESCIMKSSLGEDAYIVPGLVMGPKCCQSACPMISLAKQQDGTGKR